MGSFSDSIKKNITKVQEEVNTKLIEIAQFYFNRTVFHTPSKANPGRWARGLLANQWYPSEGMSFNSSFSMATSPNGAGSLSRIAGLTSSKAFLGKDGVLTLANNVSYAWQAEWGGWHRTPPYAMMDKARVDTLYRFNQ